MLGAVAIAASLAASPYAVAANSPSGGTKFAAGEVVTRFAGGHDRVLRLPEGVRVRTALAALRSNPHVAYALPNYIATASGLPNDPGTVPPAGGPKSGWTLLQWNFLPCGSFCNPAIAPLAYQSAGGINATGAWKNLRKRGVTGAQGVTVAILDTGVAYKDDGTKFRRSPDFGANQFVPGYDFVGKDAEPLDVNGHGTHLAGTIGEKTNNHLGLTGLAHGAKLMPVRVLNAVGNGRSDRIAKGIRFATDHGAHVINMSFNFGCGNAVPLVKKAMRYAAGKGVVLVASTGNDEPRSCVTMPASDPRAIAVGGTTEDACLGSYSKISPLVDLVAPGGGFPALGCPPASGNRPIYQLTFRSGTPNQFEIPGFYEGTSMAAAHVSGVAAMVIASGLLGPNPSPAEVLAKLTATARDLGTPGKDNEYGAGLIDAARATSP
jgi:serine protease